MAACGLFPAVIMTHFMNPGPNLGSGIADVITVTTRVSLWKARPEISFSCTAARFIVRMRIVLTVDGGPSRQHTVLPMPAARSLDNSIMTNA
jgi:hypothetical protein